MACNAMDLLIAWMMIKTDAGVGSPDFFPSGLFRPLDPSLLGHRGYLEISNEFGSAGTWNAASAIQVTNDPYDLTNAEVKQVSDFGSDIEIQIPASHDWSTWTPRGYRFIRPGVLAYVSDNDIILRLMGRAQLFQS